MAKNFNVLRQKMSPASRRRASKKTEQLLTAMALDELREARRLTQEQLGARLNVKQPAIAKIERRADLYLSTLRGVIQAMGGKMEILAVFPDCRVPIKQLRHTRSVRKARKQESGARRKVDVR